MMKHSPSLALLLAIGATAAGCAATVGGDDGPGGDGPGSGSGTGTPLTMQGRYALQSDFDIATNMPGTAGTAVNVFIAATDDPDDPTRYILDLLIAQLPDGGFKNTLKSSEGFVAGYLNDRLLDVAPNFITQIRDIGDKFGQVAHHFGTLETLDVNGGKATHTIQGLHFKVDGIELDFLFKDYGIKDVAVANVDVAMDQTGKVTLGNHAVPLSMGAMLRIGLDEVVVPLVDPSATSMSDLLHGMVNCQAVGQYVYDAIGLGSPSTFESACNSGLTAGGHAIETQLSNLDTAALEFGIQGTARAIDKNGDRMVDQIQTGTWSGTLSYVGQQAPLASGTFLGSKTP